MSSSEGKEDVHLQPPAALSPPSPQYVKLPDAQLQHGGKFYITDASYWISNSLYTVIQAFSSGVIRTQRSSSDPRNSGALAATSLQDTYDPKSRSWKAKDADAAWGGLSYRVPLMTVPSAGHCRLKLRNIQVLMHNVRDLCMNDQLPATKEEQQFWASYRFLRYQLFLLPFASCLSVTYIGAKMAFNHLPLYLKGRMPPIVFSLLIAEQAQDALFPAEDLLRTAMQAKTPLGDAARAEWLRIQPVHIPQSSWVKYRFSLWMKDPLDGFSFGENIVDAVK